MRILLIVLLSLSFISIQAQGPAIHAESVDVEPQAWREARLNTAAKANYMRPDEREMVYELNRLRSDPARYVQYLWPYLAEAKADLAKHGHGRQHYSITTIYTTDANGVENIREDTTWHDYYQEEVDAIESLIEELTHLTPLSVLQPDAGMYKAAQKHARDERQHQWELGHRGSDGSWPQERIRKFAPHMATGNENLAGKGRGRESIAISPRAIVILLLIDSGIPGYGHRKNMLNPEWTHVATCYGGWAQQMHHWVQEFGKISE